MFSLDTYFKERGKKNDMISKITLCTLLLNILKPCQKEPVLLPPYRHGVSLIQ